MESEVLDLPTKEDGLYFSSIDWWEKRRVRYNLIVFIPGMFSAIAAIYTEPSFLLLIGAAIYGLFANLCYTLGPLLEMMVTYYFNEHLSLTEYRTVLYFVGTIVSVGITELPGIAMCMVSLY